MGAPGWWKALHTACIGGPAHPVRASPAHSPWGPHLPTPCGGLTCPLPMGASPVHSPGGPHLSTPRGGLTCPLPMRASPAVTLQISALSSERGCPQGWGSVSRREGAQARG